MKETAKQTSPNVSSRGHGAKWVSWIGNVWGCTKATAAIYTHPARPKTNSVSVKARTNLIDFILTQQ